MIRSSVRVTACALVAAMSFTGMGITAEATSVLPSGGVGLTLAQDVKLENIQSNTANTSTKTIETIVEDVDTSQIMEKVFEEPEEMSFRNLVIAQVKDYVNVRNIPSEEGEIIGKLYDDSVGTFVSEENGWYQITSGSVTGYVKGEFCVTGQDAVALAKEVGTRIATVNTTTLKVRKEASIESECLCMIPLAEQYVVMEETDEWVKIDTEEGLGWVSTEFVELHTEFVQAESKEEEERRLAKEAEERRRAREAAAAATASQSVSKATTETYAVGEGSELGVAVADYALQFVGNPYVWGGTSLTNGADCSGFVMSVYANFGVSLPHSSAADRSQGSAVDGLANAQPGDLVCYSGHVAIYIGNGQIVHAASSKTGIIVSNADYKKVLAVRRIF